MVAVNRFVAILILVSAVILSAGAQARSPYEQGYEAFQQGHYVQAARIWTRLAQQGNPRAQNSLGYLYKQGLGVRRSYDQARFWYQKAADQGRTEAIYDLAVLYDEALGVKRDYKRARQLYERAAGDGFAAAYNNLGVIYANGNGVRRDLEAAYFYYAMADRLGGTKFATENRNNTGRQLATHQRKELDRLARNAEPGALYPPQEPTPEWAPPPQTSEAPAAAPFPASGLSHEEARRLQQALARLGYDPGPIDGYAGPATQAAVDAYRRDNDMNESGPPSQGFLWRLERAVAQLPPEPAFPKLALDVPDKITGDQPVLTIEGTLTGGTGSRSVTIDGRKIPVSEDGKFHYDRYLVDDEAVVTVLAEDGNGDKVSRKVTLIRERPKQENLAALEDELSPLNPVRPGAIQNPDAVALIIGVESYRKLPDAKFAERDAKAFADYAQYTLGISPARIKVLTGADAIYGEMRKALEVWLPTVAEPGASDVIVFFAGHGLSDRDSPDQGAGAYLLPRDADPELLRFLAVSRDRMIGQLSDLNARSVTVFLDTCFSGPGRSDDLLIAARPVFDVPAPKSTGAVAVLSAATGTQIAGVLPERRHGLFSYFIMRGLEGPADADQDGSVTVGELNDWVVERVERTAGLLGRSPQTPGLEGDRDTVLVRLTQ